MFDRLKHLLRGSAPAGGTRAFADMSFYFLSLPQRFQEGLPVGATQEQILTFTRDAAAELSASYADTAAGPWELGHTRA